MNTENTSPPPATINIGSIADLVNISKVHLNVSQEVIIITEDKVRICLSEHLKKMEDRRIWITPLGILLTIVITLITTDFKSVVFEAATWKAIFVIAGFFFFGWFIYSGKRALKSVKIDDIINKLKKVSEAQMKSSTIAGS